MLRLRGFSSIILGAVLCVGGVYLFWEKGQSRRAALQSISQLASDLANPNGSELLNAVVIPMAIQSQTQAEQAQFLIKALAEEVSPAGVEALKRHAEFGPLKSVFPNEALVWCSQAGVNVDDCVAFKMDRAGIRAEVVMLHEGQTYRIVRCNNVKQMAEENQI